VLYQIKHVVKLDWLYMEFSYYSNPKEGNLLNRPNQMYIVVPCPASAALPGRAVIHATILGS
jgi:hypothetical protein